MTKLLALIAVLSMPLFVAMLKQDPARRTWAFAALAALPFLTNAPVSGYFYGWGNWSGTALGYNISLTDALAIALIATRRTTPGRLPFWGVFAFYGAALIVSIFFSAMWIATTFVWWQFGRLLLLFVAVAGETHRPETRNALLVGLALGVIYQAGYVIPQKLTGTVQASGTVIHQNILGLMVELALMPLVAALLMGDRRKIILAGAAAALICIAGTGSRGTTGIAGGAIVALICLSLARRATARKITIVASGVAVLGLATPFALASLNQRFQGASYVTDEETRDNYEKAARAMADDHPLGVGANLFVYISNRDGYAERAGVSWMVSNRSKPTHNAYLLARAETGWAGEAGLIGILIVPLLTGIRIAFKDRKAPSGEIALGAAFALAANLIHNNYEFATHTYTVFSLMFVNISIIAGLWRSQRLGNSAEQPVKRRPRPIHPSLRSADQSKAANVAR